MDKQLKKNMSYENGKIYKIVNDVNDIVYIGSTTQSLCKRMYVHKSDAKVRAKTRFHTAINLIGYDHFTIILLETFPCTSKSELEAKEYAIMSAYKKDMIYNSIIGGKHSVETKIKISGRLGVNCKHFKRGCILLNSIRSAYEYQWYVNKVHHSKSFSFPNIRTQQEAYMACANLREEIYPLTFDEYSKELPFAII